MSASSSSNSNYLSRTTGWANSDPVTIACWFSFSTLGDFRSVWDHGDSTSFSPQLYFDPSPAPFGGVPSIVLASTGTGPGYIQLAATPSAGVWYWAAAVFTGTAAPVIGYIGTNGGALTKVTGGVNFAGFTGTVLTIYNEKDLDQTLTGEIKDLKIWRGTGGALSDDEIANEYLRSKPSKTSSLWGEYLLLSATGPGVDMSGNGNALTLSGTLTNQRLSPPQAWTGAM